MSIAVIILSWNNAERTIECIKSVVESIEALGPPGNPVLVVDNGSAETELLYLRRHISRLHSGKAHLIENEQNLGYSGGMNIGIKHALKEYASEFIWLLNNDVIVDKRSAGLLEKLGRERPNMVIIGPTVLHFKSGKVECAGGYYYNRILGYSTPCLAGRAPDELDGLTMPDMDYISGAAMFLRSDFLARIDGLCEDYFLYYEELDLVQRLSPAESIGWCPNAVVRHQGGASSTGDYGSRAATRNAAFSAFVYTWKYCWYFLPTVFLARFVGIALRGLTRRQPSLALSVIAAAKDFFTYCLSSTECRKS